MLWHLLFAIHLLAIFGSYASMAIAGFRHELSGKFLHITDFHLDEDYDPEGDPARFCRGQNTKSKNVVSPRFAPYGDYRCDSPMKLVEFMLDEAKMNLAEPDFILWTGDSLPHENHNNSNEKLLHYVRLATDTIRARFPDVPVIPMLGNHDSFPDNHFADHPAEQKIYGDIFELWKDWIGEGAKETFLRGAYYRLDLASMVWLVLNTNMYYIDNSASIANFVEPEDPAGQFDFLHFELEKAKQYNYSVNIVAHIAPGDLDELYNFAKKSDNLAKWKTSYGQKTTFDQLIVSPKWYQNLLRKYNQHLLALIVDYAPWIRWMMFGHFHRDAFRTVKDQNGRTVQRMFVGPGITPVYRGNNPAFRIVKYQPNRGMELEDILTYYVDLDELNAHGSDQVHAKLEYSMRGAYGMESLDAEAMGELVERIKRNRTLADEYFLYNTVQYRRPPNETERIHQLCSMEFVDYERLEKCKAEFAQTQNDGICPQAVVQLLLALVLISFIVYL